MARSDRHLADAVTVHRDRTRLRESVDGADPAGVDGDLPETPTDRDPEAVAVRWAGDY